MNHIDLIRDTLAAGKIYTVGRGFGPNETHGIFLTMTAAGEPAGGSWRYKDKVVKVTYGNNSKATQAGSLGVDGTVKLLVSELIREAA